MSSSGHDSTAGGHAAPGRDERRSDHLSRLREIEAQVHGIARMVQDDRYYLDVLTQVSAASGVLQEVALGLLGDHVRHCVVDATLPGSAQGTVRLDELVAAARLVQHH